MARAECWHRFRAVVTVGRVVKTCDYCGQHLKWTFDGAFPAHVLRWLADPLNEITTPEATP